MKRGEMGESVVARRLKWIFILGGRFLDERDQGGPAARQGVGTEQRVHACIHVSPYLFVTTQIRAAERPARLNRVRD